MSTTQNGEVARAADSNTPDTGITRIPSTIEEVTAGLDGLGQLLTATQWSRAAIVYAWTEKKANQKSAAVDSRRLGVNEFARLGLTGLSSDKTVREYRKAWEQHGDTDIGPGDEVTLPTTEWKDAFGEPTPDVQARVAKAHIAKHPEVVAEAVRSSQAAADAVAKDKKAAGAVVDRVVANAKPVGTAPASKPKASQPADPRAVLKSMTMDWGSVIADLDTLGRLIEANPDAKQGILDFAPRARSVIDNFERLEGGVRRFRNVVGVDAGESDDVKVIEGSVAK